MRVAMGCGILAHSRASGRADGIAVYTGALTEMLPKAVPGLDILPVTFGSRHAHALEGAISLPWSYPAAVALSAFVGCAFPGSSALEERADLFHAPDHYIPRLRRVPVVATIMDVIPLKHPEWVRARLRSVKSALFRRASRWAEHVITISEHSRRDIAEALDIPLERITAIPLGVQEKFFRRVPAEQLEAARRKHGLKKPYLLFVGTLQPRKNVSRLIRAHAALPEALRREFELVLVGQPGWGTDELMADIARMEGDGRGRWLRYVPEAELLPLLQGAAAVVYPSLYEGFGLPVLEGFASEVPVVTSRTTSLPEVAGDAAVLVDPLSVDSIADGIGMVLLDAQRRREMVARGLARARAFTWEETARRTAEVYRANV